MVPLRNRSKEKNQNTVLQNPETLNRRNEQRDNHDNSYGTSSEGPQNIESIWYNTAVALCIAQAYRPRRNNTCPQPWWTPDAYFSDCPPGLKTTQTRRGFCTVFGHLYLYAYFLSNSKTRDFFFSCSVLKEPNFEQTRALCVNLVRARLEQLYPSVHLQFGGLRPRALTNLPCRHFYPTPLVCPTTLGF